MVWWAGLIAAVVTLAIAPAVAALGGRWGLIDTPNYRSMHTRPTPRSGGIACIIGMAAGLAAGAEMGLNVPWALLAVAFALGLVGLADDRLHLPALARLVIQAAAGSVTGLLLGGGWWILVGVVALPIAVNMLNFMDGINGITSLTMVVWSLSVCVAGIAFSAPAFVLVGAAIAGAAVGFLPWNAPKARAFLGDGGSYAFGALVGIGTVAGVQDAVPAGVLIGPMVLYLADTGSTLLRRAMRHESLFEAHRSHTYQRLTEATGWPHLAVSSLIAAGSVVITAAWWTPWPWLGATVSAVVVIGYLLAPRLAGSPAPSAAGA